MRVYAFWPYYWSFDSSISSLEEERKTIRFPFIGFATRYDVTLMLAPAV
jgi:hypothetical protein